MSQLNPTDVYRRARDHHFASSKKPLPQPGPPSVDDINRVLDAAKNKEKRLQNSEYGKQLLGKLNLDENQWFVLHTQGPAYVVKKKRRRDPIKDSIKGTFKYLSGRKGLEVGR